MARPLRLEFEDATYHVCARGNERQKIFRDERDRARFVDLLERSGDRYQIRLLAFVLMGNHFHLLAQTPRANLSRWMHWLMVSYTVYFNRRHRRSGHLFQGRYKSFLVGAGRGRHLLTLSRYLHLNPVRGRVLGEGTPVQRRGRLRAYQWSTYRGYAGLQRQYDFVTDEPVLAELCGPGKGAAVRYRRFVEEGLVREVESPWEAVQWQSVLGDETFARRIQDRFRGLRKARREVTALRLGESVVDPEKVVRKVARAYRLPFARIREEGAYGMEARNAAIWLVWESCGLSLRQVGEFFGGLHYAAVAQRLRRVSPELQKKTRRLLNAK